MQFWTQNKKYTSIIQLVHLWVQLNSQFKEHQAVLAKVLYLY